MRNVLRGFVLVVLIGAVAYLRFHHPKPPLEVAYAGNHEVTLWSTTAQVREPVSTAGFGDQLFVLTRAGDQVQVRTSEGKTGWISQNELLTADFWEKAKNLEAKSTALPVEARGSTRVPSNLHIEPSREAPRIRQLDKNVPVELLERQPVEVPSTTPVSSGAEGAASEQAPARKEDWWFVRAQLPDQTAFAGWMLGRFINLDVPDPLPDYASSSGMRIVAWFELNRVTDSDGAEKPQYLVVGVHGSEGQTCDFTLLRVFTWGLQRQRYETAFIESDVCGKLPIHFEKAAASTGDVTFSFEDQSNGPPAERAYRMHQTIVRQIREEGGAAAQRKHAH